MAIVKQFKLKILALQLVYVVKVSNLSALALCQHFLQAVEDTQKFLNDNCLVPDAFTVAVFKDMSALLDEAKPGTVARALLPLLQSSVPTNPPRPHTDVRNKYKLCKMYINCLRVKQYCNVLLTS